MNAPVSREQWAQERAAAMDAIPQLVQEEGLPSVLLPYQAKVVGLLDTASTQVLCIEKSRRIGLTWGLGAYAVLKAARKKSARGQDVMYISYSQEMTREFMDVCGMWARAFNEACSDVEETVFTHRDKDGDQSIKAFRITFASGFEIMALSSAPRGLRGKQGVVIIDEAAFVDNLAELQKAALAFLMWGGQVVLVSTHDGVDNPFNVTIQDILGGRKPYAHVRIDLDDALRDGLYQRICLVKGDTWSPEAEADWRDKLIDFYGDGADEELFCIPSQGSGTWLAAPLIEARMTSEAPVLSLELPSDYLQRPELDQRVLFRPFLEEVQEELDRLDMDLRYAAGFDVARVADLSVIPVLAIEKTLRRREVFTIEMRAVPFDEQRQVAERVFNHIGDVLVGAAIDATGVGMQIAEDLGRRFGTRENEDDVGLIWPIKFTTEWYRVNMPPLKTAFEDDTIAIGRSDDRLGDLRLVKLIRGIPQVPDIRTNAKGEDAAGSKKGKKRHGDYAVGLALAYFASRMRWAEYGYRAVKAAKVPDPATVGRMSNRPDHSTDAAVSGSVFKEPLGRRLRGSI